MKKAITNILFGLWAACCMAFFIGLGMLFYSDSHVVTGSFEFSGYVLIGIGVVFGYVPFLMMI